MLPDVRSAGMATIAALAGATALGTFCCVSQHSAPPPTAAETSTADDVKLGGVGVPARASPVRQQDRDGDETSQHLRTTTTSSAAAEAGVDEESGLTFYGPGFAWDDHDPKPLQDAASQMFSLCLKWRAAGETLNAFKLNKLELILSRRYVARSCQVERCRGSISQRRCSWLYWTAGLLPMCVDHLKLTLLVGKRLMRWQHNCELPTRSNVRQGRGALHRKAGVTAVLEPTCNGWNVRCAPREVKNSQSRSSSTCFYTTIGRFYSQVGCGSNLEWPRVRRSA